MITNSTGRAGSHIMLVNQAFGEHVLHLNRRWDKEIAGKSPQVSHLHILEVG